MKISMTVVDDDVDNDDAGADTGASRTLPRLTVAAKCRLSFISIASPQLKRQ